MLEYVIGTKTKPGAIDNLLQALRLLNLPEGTFYVGYPVVTIQNEAVTFDALLVSKDHGLIAFDLIAAPPQQADMRAWSEIEERQQAMYLALTSRLLVNPGLVQRRQLAVPIAILTYAPHRFEVPAGLDIEAAYPENLRQAITSHAGIADDDRYRALNAAIQRVTTIKPRKKRQNVRQPDSRGAVIRRIEQEIANLDRGQKRGAIESPEGPQRIRGLAGSGKTVVLALKAAYLHAQRPDWRIAVTFQTRSLYQQFTDLVRRFSFEHTGDEPDWSQLKILHAWGTPREPGLYAEIAQHYGTMPRDFNSARAQYGRDRAFEGICAEVEAAQAKVGEKPLYDVILIDEAQDFPIPFFRICYGAAAPPKRIVWAYDELQNLSIYTMPPPSLLFGAQNGRPRVELRGDGDGPHADVILPVCYRNTPWSLAVAHALGFGIYREGGLVQLFEDQGLWNEIGYETVAGSPQPGHRVVLRRGRRSYPGFFDQLLRPEDALQCHEFDDEAAQAKWIAESIEKNVRDDELEPNDILVIFPDPVTVADRATSLIRELWARNINAHIAGVTSSRDQFFVDDSVAITGIFRAKGNEAPMVYAADSQYCHGGFELIKKRNTLFTAITRSRAWVRICGYGSSMPALRAEIERAVANSYRLEFDVPTSEQLEQLRRIHRDMTPEDRKRLGRVKDSAGELIEQLESGELALEHLPEDLRRRYERFFGGRRADGQ